MPIELDPEQDEFLGLAIQEYNQKRKETHKKYAFDKHAWSFEQDTNVFQLLKDKKVIYEADGQILGSYLKSDGTFEWAWNNPNSTKSSSIESKLVRKYGKENNLPYFSDGTALIGSEEFAAYFCAVGVKLSNSESAFHGDVGNMVVYIMLKNFREVTATK